MTDKRTMLMVKPDLSLKLSVLATLRRCSKYVLANQIVSEYLAQHEDEFQDALKIVCEHEAMIDACRAKLKGD